MQKQNLIDLTPGENRIVLTGDDVGIYMGKLPMFRIPLDSTVHNAHIEILTPFIISSGIDNRSMANSRLDFELGISSDDDYFITRIKGDSPTIQNPCSGLYFKESLLLKVPTVVYLRVYSLCKPWFISEDLNSGRHGGAGGSDSFNTAIVFGGAGLSSSEIYDRQVWSIGNKLSTTRAYHGGCGGLAGALAVGGYSNTFLNTSEKYNGITWSATGNINYARRFLFTVGNNLSAVSFGGRNENVGGDTYYTTTEEYNGTTWTLSIDSNIGRERHSGCGTIWDAMSFGGRCDFNMVPYVDFSEHYNGTSWYVGADITKPRYVGSGCGTPTAAQYICGIGVSGITDYTEEYDGVSWYPSNESLLSKYYLSSVSFSGFSMNIGGYHTVRGILKSTEKMMSIPTSAIKPLGSMVVNLTIL